MQNSSKDGGTKTSMSNVPLFFLKLNSLLTGVVQTDIDVKLNIVCKTLVKTVEPKCPCQTSFFERCLYFNSLLPGVVQIDYDVKLTINCKTVVRTGEPKHSC